MNLLLDYARLFFWLQYYFSEHCNFLTWKHNKKVYVTKIKTQINATFIVNLAHGAVPFLIRFSAHLHGTMQGGLYDGLKCPEFFVDCVLLLLSHYQCPNKVEKSSQIQWCFFFVSHKACVKYFLGLKKNRESSPPQKKE